MLKDDQVP